MRKSTTEVPRRAGSAVVGAFSVIAIALPGLACGSDDSVGGSTTTEASAQRSTVTSPGSPSDTVKGGGDMTAEAATARKAVESAADMCDAMAAVESMPDSSATTPEEGKATVELTTAMMRKLAELSDDDVTADKLRKGAEAMEKAGEAVGWDPSKVGSTTSSDPVLEAGLEAMTTALFQGAIDCDPEMKAQLGQTGGGQP
jgi:hypothetical protein